VYLGLGGGVALPYGAIRTVNQPGELAQVNLGWQPLNSVLGIRVDGTWNRYQLNPDYNALNSPGTKDVRPMMLTGNAGLRLDLPFFNSLLGSSVRLKPYLIGGGSYIHYSDLRMQLDADNNAGAAVGGYGYEHAVFATDMNSAAQSGSDSEWGWYAGGGLGFHAGRKEIFIESRAISFRHNSNNSPVPFERSWNVPLVFGINLY
jgi:hypothetical protein